MPVVPDRRAFLSSLGAELDVQAQRVRHLIGDNHWLSDGHHKEYLLRALLSRHLPAAASCVRGFVVNPLADTECSTEQDVLVVDPRTEAPLFNQGGLAVCFPSAVLAAVSVKSAFRPDGLDDALRGLLEKKVLLAGQDGGAPWLGVYFFNDDDRPEREEYFAEKIVETLSKIEFTPVDTEVCLRLSQTYFARVNISAPQSVADVFSAEDCSTGLFLSRLLDRLASVMGGGHSDFSDMIDVETDTGINSVRRATGG